ncbi:hypothetical protein ACRS34_18890 [Stutzerimonas stutzeri]|uniref:hypothetical protein n=1 Tax=Stutzerimonas stutzeri TaxID=316 RepID=UPI003EE38162
MNRHVAPAAFAAGFLLFSNAFFYLLSEHLNIGRPYINLDYLIAGSLITFQHRRSGIFIFCICVTLDTIATLGQLFPFVRISDLIYLTQFLLFSPAAYQGYVVAILICCVITITVSARFAARQNQHLALGTLIAATVAYIPYAYSDQSEKFWKITSSQIVGSQAAYILTYRTSTFLDGYSMKGPPFSLSRARGATEHIFENPYRAPNKLLLIVNESWGMANKENINQALLNPITSSLPGTEVKKGSLHFTGATLAGELRELCQLKPNHFNLKNVEQGFGECLPQKLAALGYMTTSLHGAMSVMYDRKYWYPRAGFQKSIFFESTEWPKRCHSFPGACDADIANLIPPLFAEGKQLVYWLSLNTHSTYDERDIQIEGIDCIKLGIHTNTETCRNLKLQWQFFYIISQMIRHPNMEGTHIIVVGDHPPPIFDQKEKAQHFVDSTVPWISFQVPPR